MHYYKQQDCRMCHTSAILDGNIAEVHCRMYPYCSVVIAHWMYIAIISLPLMPLMFLLGPGMTKYLLTCIIVYNVVILADIQFSLYVSRLPEFAIKVVEEITAFTVMNSLGKVIERDDRPALLVSSTIWTGIYLYM